MTNRAKFVELLAERDVMNNQRWRFRIDGAYAAVADRLRAELPGIWPKSRKGKLAPDWPSLSYTDLREMAIKRLGFDGWGIFLAPYCMWSETEDRKMKADVNWAETQLQRLAQEIEPLSGDTWRTIETISGSSYRTQGFGANKYAEASAEQTADHYRHQGLDARVVCIKRPHPETVPWHYVHTNDYRIEVRAEEVDIEIAKRRPGPTLKEWIRLCWKRGVNPRVYNPWLPYGIEKKLGLDYFGGAA